MEIAVQVLAGTLMVLGTVLGLVWFQRSLDRPGGRTGLGGIGDAFGNLTDVFEPGQARAARELKHHLNTGPVTPVPDDDDDDPVRLITHPDGTPRTVRVRRSTGLRLAPLTGEQALAIVTWRYPPPYDCYDMTGAGPDELLTPGAGYFAVLAGGRLVGFWAFGDDGRVPGGEYDDSALDIGGGLRPELVGRGLGREVVAAGLAHGRELFAPIAFRVTVASFNERALRTVEAAGFRRVDRFVAPTGRSFEVLVRAER